MKVGSGRGTAQDLWRLQSLAAHSLVISATQKCPLSCAHCITSSGPDAPGPVLSPALAGIWAGDFPAMAAAGLRHVSLTGGEPILALDAVALLVHAAAASGMAAFVVSSGAWARTPDAARRVVAKAGPVTRWDLGTDGWHAAEMPLERIDHAITAIVETGSAVTVRMCEAADPARNEEMEQAVAGVVRDRAEIQRQSVRRIGRAAGSDPSRGQVGLPRRPCVSTGLFVRADGTTGPCCSGLAYEARGQHPLTYGQIRTPGALLDAWMAWRADPLLRVMRLASMAALQGWLPDRLKSEAFSQDPCEACVGLYSRLAPHEAEHLAERAGMTAVTEKLDLLESVLLGELTHHDTANAIHAGA